MSGLKTRQEVDVQVRTRGRVPHSAAEYAQEKVAAVLVHLSEPVLAARVKLTQVAGTPEATAQAMVDVNGRPVRAHVAATTLFEAVDLLQDRLRARLARVRRHASRGPDRHGPDEPRPAPAGDAHRPRRRHVPAEERGVVRRKTFFLARQTPEDAVIDLEAMDHGFWLFTDLATGHDSVVYRDTRTGRPRMASLGTPRPERAGEFTVSAAPVPASTVAGAVQRLRLTGLPFVFFRDTATGRGSVLYHRYDGHYGLITPAP
ncbi:sigma 54 modulation/S30EA ribosomal C-terminal domain-containing protein [Streptomyces fradiae]|uniref:sigma 54 modulation/S30EA ribosomal C-terminal domain-containing protein n=1 Tax=Streptomyces fradiae TaxID=1906 RepID=UPI0036B8080A